MEWRELAGRLRGLAAWVECAYPQGYWVQSTSAPVQELGRLYQEAAEPTDGGHPPPARTTEGKESLWLG
jgi:hypothetical protein